jgi:excinuclease ABC subunit A
LYSTVKLAKVRNYKPGMFSFNVEGGRCDICQGEGVVKIEMQFMADIFLKCDHCQGKRFKQEVLDVKYRGKDISDILEMTVDEALEFFNEDKKDTLSLKIAEKIQVLHEVGLGYVHLGQSSNTLSGGEAQRIKLAFFLSKGGSVARTLFIFDEPTTGLHFHDIQKLNKALNALVTQGHTVIVIEHNTEMMACADWIIELGPEGGDKGGELVFEGKFEDLLKVKNSYTAMFLNG